MVLVVARHDLDQSRAVLPEHREMPEQIEQAAMFEHALSQNGELWSALFRIRRAVGGAPGHETLEIGGERADAGGDAVRDHQKGVGMKQRRNLQLVGLELVEGGRQRCLAAARRFQFDHDEG